MKYRHTKGYTAVYREEGNCDIFSPLGTRIGEINEVFLKDSLDWTAEVVVEHIVYTFSIVNTYKKYYMYAENKEAAFAEIRKRFGDEAEKFSLTAYCDAKTFGVFTK